MPFSDKLPNTKGKKRKRDPANITLSSDEKAVLAQLNHLHWPKGSAQLLPSVVRTSMRNYNRFLKTFKKILATSKEEFPKGTMRVGKHRTYSDLHQFIQNKLSKSFLPADEYVVCWFESVNRKVLHWKGWNGNLRPFSIEAKEFQLEGADLAVDWSGNSGALLWKEFYKLIQEEME